MSMTWPTIAFEILGWFGAVACVAAYFLVSNRILSSQSALFQGLNLLGGLGLFANTLFRGAWPSAAVNLIWMGIAIAALARAQAHEKSSNNP